MLQTQLAQLIKSIFCCHKKGLCSLKKKKIFVYMVLMVNEVDGPSLIGPTQKCEAVDVGQLVFETPCHTHLCPFCFLLTLP